MAVFIDREHTSPDFAAQELRQHSGVIALIEAIVRPRKIIQEYVHGPKSNRDAKQDSPAPVGG